MALQACDRMVGRVRRQGRRLGEVHAESTAESRVFDVFALGDDLFLIQRVDAGDTPAHERRRSMVLIEQRDLRIGKRGWLCALGTGYFGTILTPLFTGALGPDLCRVPKARRSAVLTRRVVLANVSDGVAELLQRQPLPGGDQFVDVELQQTAAAVEAEQTEAAEEQKKFQQNHFAVPSPSSLPGGIFRQISMQ